MRIYVDGTALSRYLVDDGATAGAGSDRVEQADHSERAEHAAWVEWATAHAAELVTTPLAIDELRRVAAPLGVAARQTARDVADAVEVVRFSDQALETAAMAASVLGAFESLHLGVAVSDPDVRTVATYSPLLATVAAIYGLEVVTPGRAPRWWERLA